MIYPQTPTLPVYDILPLTFRGAFNQCIYYSLRTYKTQVHMGKECTVSESVHTSILLYFPQFTYRLRTSNLDSGKCKRFPRHGRFQSSTQPDCSGPRYWQGQAGWGLLSPDKRIYKRQEKKGQLRSHFVYPRHNHLLDISFPVRLERSWQPLRPGGWELHPH